MAAAETGGSEMTAKEAQVYDRQIRLWGVEAQKRMKESMLLFVGVSGASAEAIKNVVLSGMNVKVLDPEITKMHHIGANVLLGAGAVGIRKDTAALVSMRELNPYVSLARSSAGSPIPSTQADLEDAQVVILANATATDKLKVSALCRSSGVKLLCIDSNGMVQSILVDLAEHTFKKTEQIGRKDQETKKVVTVETMTTPDLKEVLTGAWGGAALKEGRKLTTMAGLANLALDAAALDGRLPACPELPSSAAEAAVGSESSKTVPLMLPEAIAAVEAERAAWASRAAEAAAAAAEARGIAGAADFLSPLLGAACKGYGLDFAPVGSVAGGALAREISKLVTGSDEPFANILGVDGLRLEVRRGRLPLSGGFIAEEAARARAKVQASAGDAMSIDDSSDDEGEVAPGDKAGAGVGEASLASGSELGGSAPAQGGGGGSSDDEIEVVGVHSGGGEQAGMEQ